MLVMLGAVENRNKRAEIWGGAHEV